ncbi:DNA topoisomerase 2-alpha [Dermatophagoides farinae]|uniref:DNA topoisomerase 2 n=1 Tax=Dermatophagoides farinae TaxID=6954 RepID=A0A9D4P4V4_DERFA|nr:dna topoisomerase 2-alpha-like protein [Dermatophagoides farinae]
MILSPLARKIFSPLDDPLLTYEYEGNRKMEPKCFVPIIPMVLVNGVEDSTSIFKSKVPKHNPRDIVDNIRRMLRNEEPLEMNPWYKNFKGTVVKVEPMKYIISGEVAKLDEQTIEITELPIGTCIEDYKETILEPMLHGTGKSPALINDYQEYHTDTTVKFVVKMNKNALEKVMRDGIHKKFKLQTSLSISSMFLFDQNDDIKKYESPLDILREFFTMRMDFYVRRKKYYEAMFEAELLKLENQVRFILELDEKKIITKNTKKKEYIKLLIEQKYDSDPVKAWHDTTSNNENENVEDGDKMPETEEEKKYDFDYLIDMTIRTMIKGRVEELMKKRDAKKSELEELKRSTPKKLWEKDLDSFVEEYERLEKNEIQKKSAWISNLADIYKPSVHAVRIEPKIDFEKYQSKKERVKKSNNNKEETKNDDGDTDVDAVEGLSKNLNLQTTIDYGQTNDSKMKKDVEIEKKKTVAATSSTSNEKQKSNESDNEIVGNSAKTIAN